MCKKINRDKTINLKKAWWLVKYWKRAAIIGRALDHFFAVGSFVASVSVIYVSAELNSPKTIIIVLSSIAAMLTVMGYACNPTRDMVNYRIAFEVLNDALISNTDKDGNLIDDQNSWGEIAKAIIQGEKYIGKTYNVVAYDQIERNQ